MASRDAKTSGCAVVDQKQKSQSPRTMTAPTTNLPASLPRHGPAMEWNPAPIAPIRRYSSFIPFYGFESRPIAPRDTVPAKDATFPLAVPDMVATHESRYTVPDMIVRHESPLCFPRRALRHESPLDPDLPDIVETQGRHLTTKPATPVPPRLWPEDIEFITELHRSLDRLLNFSLILRRQKYGEIADEYPRGWTPVDVRERWIAEQEEHERELERMLEEGYTTTDEEAENSTFPAPPQSSRRKRDRDEEDEGDNVNLKEATASSKAGDNGTGRAAAAGARKRRRMG